MEVVPSWEDAGTQAQVGKIRNFTQSLCKRVSGSHSLEKTYAVLRDEEEIPKISNCEATTPPTI